MNKNSFLAALLVVVVGCTRVNVDETSELNEFSAAFWMKPDSLFTPEENKLRSNLEDLLWTHVEIIDKKLVLTLGNESFEKKGIPEIYYSMLKKDVENINNYIDTASTPFPEALVEDFLTKQKEYIDSKGKVQ